MTQLNEILQNEIIHVTRTQIKKQTIAGLQNSPLYHLLATCLL